MPIKDTSLDQGTNRKHPVPQNVMDVEFKVVGDLTVRQIVYIAVGGSIAYIFWRSGLPVVWQWGLVGGTALLTLAVSFVPYEDRGLDKWLVIFIRAMFAPTQMIWQKSFSSPAYFLSDYAQIIKNEIITLTPVKNRTRLEEYLDLIEDKNDTLEMDRSTKLSVINDLFAVSSQKGTPVPAGRARIDDSQNNSPSLIIPTINEPQQHQPDVKVISTKPIPQEEIHNDEIASKTEFVSEVFPTEKEHIKEVLPEVHIENQVDRPISVLPNMGTVMTDNKELKVTNFRKLPSIIVEEDIKDIREKEESLEKKVNELIEVAKRARSKYQIETGNMIPTKNEKLEQAKIKFGELEKEKEKLILELTKSTEQVKHMEKSAKKKEILEEQVEKLTNRNEYLEKILSDLKSELYDLKHQKEVEEESSMRMDEIIHANKEHNQQHNLASNIISGTVKDAKGKLVEDAVILIKDETGNVARALKTNALGQFASQSSMENGTYKVEVVKGGLVFDIMLVEAKGEPINPLYFVSTS